MMMLIRLRVTLGRAVTALLLAVGCLPAPAQENDAEARLLRWMDRIAQQQLDRREAEIASIRTVEDAVRRQKQVREKILELIGGLPDYNGPLNAKVMGRIEKPKYSVEKVVFESLPRLWVTANVYRPNQPGRYPGVLIALGHWDTGKVAEQRTAVNLALKGFVVLAWDPIGQGERQQAYDPRTGASLGAWSVEQHFQAGGQSLLIGESFARYRIWDAKRALDYLVSRPDVDASRIGCTGCSGGGTVTTYISALDDRIKAAAPACYMNSFRTLFTGPVGDSEQSFPYFLSSGLDQTDFVELFAPKPWLIVSTIEDFFPLEGARHIYEEARRWYEIFGAKDRIGWAVGPGPHGTPEPIRERIYEWMIRWLNHGEGEWREQPVDMLADHELTVLPSGQVSVDLGARDLYDYIREEYQRRRAKQPGSLQELRDEIGRLMQPLAEAPLNVRVLEETRGQDWITQRIALETEPGIELHGSLLLPRAEGRKPALIALAAGDALAPSAAEAVRRGIVVLSLALRGVPRREDRRPFAGDYLANTRAWLIGRNLSAMRAFDIRRAVDYLVSRPDVDPGAIRGSARGEPGFWMLLAAAVDPRLSGVWLDKTPFSLRAALDRPLNRNLHAAIVPGFCLRWDMSDLVRAAENRAVLWTDPVDWLGVPAYPAGDYKYRKFEEGDARFLDELFGSRK
ncbi:MAG: acetylxylan esterase [Bryobacteraceae bacterium]|nr:acetylxylan esterase [Bryobacteraceae bacterium]